MNDWNEIPQTGAPDFGRDFGQAGQPATSEPVAEAAGTGAAAFCQNCGKPLTAETMRRVGPAVYCEPCLAERLAGGAGYRPGYTAAPGAAAGVGWVPPAAVPNPGTAALLGLLPGVGAMYNEQYAKGIVHLVVFAVLVMFAHISGVFGLFIMGWVAYMVIEAHHTAKARRDGTPLPNPFGLNDIGERMGFGRAWPGAADVAGVARDAAEAAAANFRSRAYPPPYAGAAGGPSGGAAYAAPAGVPTDPAAAAAGWGAPVETYGAPIGTEFGAGFGAGFGVPASGPTPYSATNVPYGAPFVAPPVPPFAAAVPPFVTTEPVLRNRFPAGALWLIGLGVLFLLGTTEIFSAFPAEALVGVGLIGLGVLVFVRRMLDTGPSLGNDGTPAYPLRLLRAGRAAVWLDLLGALFVLDAVHAVSWNHSWPALIILAGVLMLLERAAYNSAAATAYVPPPAYSASFEAPGYGSGYGAGYPVEPVVPAADAPTEVTGTHDAAANEKHQGGL